MCLWILITLAGMFHRKQATERRYNFPLHPMSVLPYTTWHMEITSFHLNVVCCWKTKCHSCWHLLRYSLITSTDFPGSFCEKLNRWRTVVSGTWKYDDPRLNMSHEVEYVTRGHSPSVTFSTQGRHNFHAPRTTVCHMFCRMANYNNLEIKVA